MFVNLDEIKVDESSEDEMSENRQKKRRSQRMAFAIAQLNFRDDFSRFTDFIVRKYSDFSHSSTEYSRSSPGYQFVSMSTVDVLITTQILRDAVNHMVPQRKTVYINAKSPCHLGECLTEIEEERPSILQRNFFLVRNSFKMVKNIYTVITREKNKIRCTIVGMTPYDAALAHSNGLRFLVGKNNNGEILCVPVHAADLMYSCRDVKEVKCLEFF